MMSMRRGIQRRSVSAAFCIAMAVVLAAFWIAALRSVALYGLCHIYRLSRSDHASPWVFSALRYPCSHASAWNMPCRPLNPS